MAGETYSFGPNPANVFVFKYNESTDKFEWEKVWDRSEGEHAYDLTVDSSGYIYVAGYTQPSGGDSDVFLLKISSSKGEILWKKEWSAASSDVAYAASVDTSGIVYVVAQTASFGAGDWNILLLQFDTMGMLSTQKVWISTGGESNPGMIVDASGNIYIAGRTYNNEGSWQDAPGSCTDITGDSVTSVTGTVNDLSFLPMSPSGTSTTTPAGTLDTGAGNLDSLIMKIKF